MHATAFSLALAVAALVIVSHVRAALASARGTKRSNRGGGVGIVFAVVVAGAAAQACHGSEECRFDPDCGGGLGGFCDRDRDCADGYCCHSDNCGGGMCTLECDRDRDCPGGMRCEHDKCFFACDSDRDCADGASCEHGNTVCEWD